MDIEKIKKQKTIPELLEFSIININKPSGPTSFNVSDFIRKTLNETGIKVGKTSHFGTLDPKVTGVLPVALSRACKLTGFFLNKDKEYVGIMRIHEDLKKEDIEKVIKKEFLGRILQTPPKKSRVKRQQREREVKDFRLLEQEGRNILFIAEVQAGTYIRKLISDLGEKMKVGMHMLELRRIRAGIFLEENSVDLYEFVKAVEEFKKGDEKSLRRILIRGEIISEIYPVAEIKSENLKKIFTGKPIMKEDLLKDYDYEKGEIICIFFKEEFIGMYEASDSKEIFAKPKFVLQPLKK